MLRGFRSVGTTALEAINSGSINRGLIRRQEKPVYRVHRAHPSKTVKGGASPFNEATKNENFKAGPALQNRRLV